jgi:glycosyltransferase involved in cell wall biosynthesis
MNIVFVIKAMGNPGGGAERVLAEVANGLVMRGHRITVLTSDRAGDASYYALHAAIRFVALDIGDTASDSKLREVYRRMQDYRSAITAMRPDAVVAFMNSSYIPAGVALLGTGIPLVASEHIGPEHYRRRPFEWLLMQTLPFIAAKITVVSSQIRDSFNGWLRRKMTAIVNPVSWVPAARPVTGAEQNVAPYRILSVGRLVAQKNQACLIDAFARIAGDFPDWTLRIAGEGELRHALEGQVDRLGLARRVELPGNIADISGEYRRADLFVLPSRYESFGLATAEAIIHGLPVIGFADCPGTNELIRNGENGILVTGADKVDALSKAMAALMQDPQARAALQNAPTGWLQEKYALDTVLDDWERLLHALEEQA